MTTPLFLRDDSGAAHQDPDLITAENSAEALLQRIKTELERKFVVSTNLAN
jgi:hypothetical protein